MRGIIIAGTARQSRNIPKRLDCFPAVRNDEKVKARSLSTPITGLIPLRFTAAATPNFYEIKGSEPMHPISELISPPQEAASITRLREYPLDINKGYSLIA